VKAPGAVDNGTGSGAVMEMARIFASHKPKVTVHFIFFTGEEIGLLGSKLHSNECKEKNMNIKMMLNMDMIGWRSPENPRMDIETDYPYENIARLFKESSLHYSDIPSVISLHAWGSDHVSYIRRDIPSILTINEKATSYEFYHTTHDTIEQVDKDIAYQFLKTNVAAMAQFLYFDFEFVSESKTETSEVDSLTDFFSITTI